MTYSILRLFIRTHLALARPLGIALLATITLVGPSRAEIRFIPMEPEAVQTMLTPAAPIQAAPEALVGPGTTLLLPYFQIEPGLDPNTTHIGIRNVSLLSDTTVSIAYYSRAGNLSTIEVGVMIPAAGVYTRNLKHVAGLPADPDGIKRGYAIVSGPDPISGEYFQLDPQNAFATGSRMVANGELCFISDARFILGGPFTGGTRFQLYVDNPLGIQVGDPPSASFTIANEAGTIYGTVGLQTDQVVNDFAIGDVLGALPGGVGPSFGSVLAIHSASAGYGLMTVTYSALGQYSVGMSGSCQTPAP
ncbi:MAG: hypothetical protein K8J08_06210 [Thermoanaerobaculia bacterium]|nr:hypothetical protein [Thermoanaerobaculia bacterium]